MIVRCPECSTGFKLPEEKISDDSVKLRCSKCSHVFRIRLDADGETEIFYNEGDRRRNEELAAEDEEGANLEQRSDAEPDPTHADGFDPNKTQLGTPSSYHEGDRSPEEELSADADAGGGADHEAESDPEPAPMNADDVDPNKTQIGAPSSTMADAPDPDASRLDVAQPPASTTNDGMPTASDDADDGSDKAPKRSKSASSDYNPFPHANLDVKPNSGSPLGDAQPKASGESGADQPAPAEQGQDLDWGNEATRVGEAPIQDDDDPFDDAFEEDDASDEDDAFEGAFDESAKQSEPAAPDTDVAVADKPAPSQTQQPDTQAPPSAGADAAAAAQASAAVAEAAQKPEAQPAQKKAPLGAGSNAAYRPEEMVDPSFGQDGPAFDPEKGVVDQKPAAHSNTQQANAPAAARDAAPAPAAQRQQSAPAPAAQSEPAPQKAEWSVDPIDEPLAPHTIGGSGLQKTANFLLILLLVGLGFLTTVAALSGWMVDFKRFPHMLEVAFEGAAFEPRSEWSADEAPVVAPAPEDPVQFESVFATPVDLGDDQKVILVQGRAKNIGSTAFGDVTVRGILYDANERVMSETTAPLGARILQSDLGEVSSSEEAAALLPESAAMLDGESSQPFTLIFVDAPGKVFQGADALFRVEVADKRPVGGPPTGQ